MGTSGNALINNIEVAEVISALDSLYGYEMVAMHYVLAVHNRLEGQALFLLAQEIDQKVEMNLSHARKLADRIGQLGGAVTGDPGRLIKISPIETFALPSSSSDVGEILAHILEQIRIGIRAYGHLLERTRGKDDVTYHLVLDVLKDHIDSEDEIESVMASP